MCWLGRCAGGPTTAHFIRERLYLYRSSATFGRTEPAATFLQNRGCPVLVTISVSVTPCDNKPQMRSMSCSSTTAAIRAVWVAPFAESESVCFPIAYACTVVFSARAHLEGAYLSSDAPSDQQMQLLDGDFRPTQCMRNQGCHFGHRLAFG